MKRKNRSAAPVKGRENEARYVTDRGTVVLLEESHDLPLIDFGILLRTGSVHDPAEHEGLARFVWRALRMGTAKMKTAEVEESLSRLGGRLSIDTSTSFVRVQGSVIKRNLDPFFALVGKLLLEPAFRAADLAQVRRETIADIVSAKDSDRALAAKFFRREVYRDHVYGRSVIGTSASVRGIKRPEVEAFYRDHFVASNAIVAFAGDVNEGEVRALVDRYLSTIPEGAAPADRVPPPAVVKGRRVLVVDKPARTQTQIFMGGLGSKIGDDDLEGLLVANTAFGGTFTARLMNEVRSKRGWSYGAYSRIGQDRERDTFYLWTFPSSKDVVACIELQLDMLEKLLDSGISQRETQFAKSFLVNGHCFERDTAHKRIDPRVDVELFGLPPDHPYTFVERIRAVRREDANAAIARRLTAKDLAIVLVATASEVVPGLEKLPSVREVTVVPYDSD